jgi:tetratricopeptide (TPR) repeat protein
MEVIRYLSFRIMFFLFLICLVISCKTDSKCEETYKNEVFSGDTDLDFFTAKIQENGLDPELRFKRASVLYDRGKYSEAIEDLRVAITIDSLEPRYYHLLSDVFLDDNNSNKAVQTLKVASQLFPERIPTLLKLSEMHYIIKQYQESIGVLNNIVRLDPRNAEAYFMLGLNFRSLGESMRAKNALQTATEFDAKLIDAWLVLAEMLVDEGNPGAEEYLKTALLIDPKNINTLHSMAYFKQNHDQVDEALELYREINEIDKNYADAYLNAGILRLERNEIDQALEQFNIFVGLEPTNAMAHYYKGYTNYLLGEKDIAKLSIQNAIKLKSDYTKAKEVLQKIENR